VFVGICGIGFIAVFALIIKKKEIKAEPEKSEYQKQKDQERKEELKHQLSIAKSTRSIREDNR
jgi:H+/gluconate symporter-like permease